MLYPVQWNVYRIMTLSVGLKILSRPNSELSLTDIINENKVTTNQLKSENKNKNNLIISMINQIEKVIIHSLRCVQI